MAAAQPADVFETPHLPANRDRITIQFRSERSDRRSDAGTFTVCVVGERLRECYQVRTIDTRRTCEERKVVQRELMSLMTHQRASPQEVRRQARGHRYSPIPVRWIRCYWCECR